MVLEWKTFLIVCPMVFLAGFVDGIGGGGGLISLPAYLFAGLPPHMAVATNKLSSCTGTLVSTLRYIKNGCADLPLAVPGVIASLLGAQIGARIALRVPENVFRIMLLVLLPVIALYVLLKRDLEPKNPEPMPRKKQIIIVAAVSLVCGMYDGFYGPGTGTFLILLYTALARLDVRTAGGNTKIANLASNASSLCVFLTQGAVLIPLGLTASAFSILGHYLGSGMAIRNGAKFVRIIILIVLALLAVKVVTDLIA